MHFYCTVLLIAGHLAAAHDLLQNSEDQSQEVYLPPTDFVKFALFGLGDVDKDNQLTFDEFLHTDKLLLKDLLRGFAQIDKNNDSFASKEEYIEWYEKREADYKRKVEEYQNAITSPLKIPYQFDTPGVRFARGDANKDGKLAFEEIFYTDKFILDQFRSQFKKMDANVDGFVTKEELNAYIEKLN
uniref:EF-hand domain-containing protein n=1 Tax=Plectus sambesii TaxID=2011161 RepID=A0A914VPD5_9BILA